MTAGRRRVTSRLNHHQSSKHPRSRQVARDPGLNHLYDTRGLSADESLFRLFVETVREYAMYTMDPHGHITTWNTGAERLKGYTQAEVIGRHFSIFFPQEDVAVNKPDILLESARANGQAMEEGWRVRKDGSRFWANILITAIHGDDGSLVGFSKITRDLTAKKKDEERLFKEMQQLQEILNHSPSLIFLKDLDGRYLRVNREFERQFGLTAKQIIGKTDLELFPESQARQFIDNDKAVLTRREALRFEETARYVGGEHSSIVVKYPLVDSDGRVYALGGIVTDITGWTLAEAKFKGLLEAAPDGMVISDRDGRITIVNSQIEAMFGYAREELFGKPVEFLIPVRFRKRHPVHRAMYSHLPKKRTMGEGLELYGLRKDGTEFPVDISLSPFETENGTLVIAAIRDISDRKRTAVELRESHEKLRALGAHLETVREEEKERIALEVHDELGQLLTALKMDLTLLSDEMNDSNITTPAAVQDLFASTKKVTDAAIQRTRDIASELRPPILKHLGLKAATEWVAAEMLKRSHIVPSIESEGDDPVLDHRTALAAYRIIQEALTNIVRHSGATHAGITFGSTSDSLTISVWDNGKGVSPDEERRIQSFGIIGMKERAALVGGELSLGNRRGGGTTIALRLPLDRRTDAGSEKEQ